jgi:hypothetical protein
MKEKKYEFVRGGFTDTSEAPRAPDLYYQCVKCGKAVPSQPDDNVGCDCGNIFIDIDYHRLAVADFSKFKLVKRVDG